MGRTQSDDPHTGGELHAGATAPQLRSPWRGWSRLALSLVLGGLVVLLWVRSYRHVDYGVLFLPGGAAQGAASVRGRVLVVFSNISFGRERGMSVDGGAVTREEFQPVWDLFYGSVSPRHELRGLLGYAVGPAGAVVPNGSHVALLVPHGLLLVLVLLPGVMWLRRALRRRRWLRTGRCPHCGYDVRASAGRCPECGEVLDEPDLTAGARAMRVMAVLAVAAVLLAAASVASAWGRSRPPAGAEPMLTDADSRLARAVETFPDRPMSFEAFVAELHNRTGTDVVVDWNALQAAGVDRNTTVDLDNVDGDSGAEILSSVAAWMQAHGGGIGYTTAGNTVLITSARELARRAVLRVYDVRDLVAKDLPVGVGHVANDGGRGDPQDERCHELVALAGQWTRELTAGRAGYRGSYRCFDGWLVAVQDDTVHRQLRQWLKWLRTKN